MVRIFESTGNVWVISPLINVLTAPNKVPPTGIMPPLITVLVCASIILPNPVTATSDISSNPGVVVAGVVAVTTKSNNP